MATSNQLLVKGAALDFPKQKESSKRTLTFIIVGILSAVIASFAFPGLADFMWFVLLGHSLLPDNSLLSSIIGFLLVFGVLFLIFSQFSAKKKREIPQEVEQARLAKKREEQVITAKNLELEKQIGLLQEKMAVLSKDSDAEIKTHRELMNNGLTKIIHESESELRELENKMNQQRNMMSSLATQIEEEQNHTIRLKQDNQELHQSLQQQQSEIKTVIIRSQELEQKKKAEVQRIKAENQSRLKCELDDLESDWKKKNDLLEARKQEELQKLEQQLKEEEKRRAILEEKHQLELAKQNLQKKMDDEQYSTLKQMKTQLLELKTQFQSILSDNHNHTTPTTPEETTVIQSLITMVDESINSLELQTQSVKTKSVLTASLRMINQQLQKLRNSINLQRASPVLFVTEAEKTSIFTTTNRLTFMCECCYTPVTTIEIKERRKWAKYSLLGLKVLVGFAIQQGFGFLNQNAGALLGNSTLESVLDSGVNSCVEKVGDYWANLIDSANLANNDEFTDTANEIVSEVQKELGQEMNLPKILGLSALYFQKEIKSQELDAIEKYLDQREKDLWKSFSKQEQEELRDLLKSTENAHVFSNAFILKNGLYMCESCAQWYDDKSLNPTF